MTGTLSGLFLNRRSVLRTASCGGLSLAAIGAAPRASLGSVDDTRIEDDALIHRLLGRTAIESATVRLDMPPDFGNGYSVPLSFAVDSPMTGDDHVRMVHVLAPKNPIIVVARFHFTPRGGKAALSTRVRLSQPQSVLVVAEKSDGALLMARTWVNVETDGCA